MTTERKAPPRIWLCPQNYEAATACCHPSDAEYVRADLVERKWHPIETAPTDIEVIWVWDDGSMRIAQHDPAWNMWYPETPSAWTFLPSPPVEKANPL